MGRTTIVVQRTTGRLSFSKMRSLRVTAASRDGFFTRMTPSYRTRHAALRQQIVEKAAGSLSPNELHTIRQQYALMVDNTLRKFRLDTLELIAGEANENHRTFRWVRESFSETEIREHYHFAHIVWCPGPRILMNLLHDVREAHPMFAMQDLSDLTGDDREKTETMLMAASLLRKTMEARSYDSGYPKVTEFYFLSMEKRGFLSPALAEVLMGREGCVDALENYLSDDRELPYYEAEVEHFREFLELPSQALRSGTL